MRFPQGCAAEPVVWLRDTGGRGLPTSPLGRRGAQPEGEGVEQARTGEGWSGGRIVASAGVALLVLLPVTLPVPVLRELVQVRFEVSDLLTSLFMSINMIGAALSAPLVGALADRFGNRRTLVVGALLVDAACFLGLAWAPSFGLFLAIRFFEGCAHILALSMILSLASEARPEAERGRVMGMVGGGMMLGVAIGAPIGGMLGRDDPLVPLQVGALVSLVAAGAALAALREGGFGQGARARPGFAEIGRLLRSDRLLAVPLLFAFADRFTVGFYTATFTLWLRNVYDVPASQIGMLIAVFMLPFALLSVPFGWLSERTSRTLLLCGGSLLYGIGTASLTHWPAAALPFVMAAIGTTAAAMFVPSLVMTTRLAPEAVRSTALGAFNAAGSLGFIVGPLTGGLVTQLVAAGSGPEAGYRAAFWVAGASEVLLGLIAFPLLWRRERAGDSRLAREGIAPRS